MTSKVRVRTRVAPSPTGFAHVGTAYAALFNWAFAKKNNGDFVLRLEDSDVKRNVAGAEEAIYGGLAWLGLGWDEGPDRGGPHGPYRLSERLPIYRQKAGQLVDEGKAYEEKGAIKLKAPLQAFSWKDLIRGEISFPKEEVKDFVIIKSDGYPTYSFAVALDDILMEISHVIRGEEHISNTPRQLVVYEAVNVLPPQFAHLPTLRNVEHKKLSKRRDPVDLRFFREQGYLPEALVNFLCLLGWSHPEGKEVFSLDEFADHFDLARVRPSGPFFDTTKLDWLNGVYIRQQDSRKLAQLISKHVAADVDTAFLERVVVLIKERITKLSEAETLLAFFWERPYLGKDLFAAGHAAEHIAVALTALRPVDSWSLPQVNSVLAKAVKKEGFETGAFYMSLRIAITGQQVTPPINESMEILGKDEVLYRLGEAEKILI